ncbi:MAG: RusA family crossover junction endodeoxyribonuclease [Planctomycetota bacterium]
MTATTEVEVSGDWERQHFILPGPPCVAPRPRVSKWGTYYPKKYTNWKKDTEAALPVLPEEFQRAAHVEIHLAFFIEHARTSKLTRPSGDFDNYAKAICDVLTKNGFWKDDVDVVTASITKRFVETGREPYTEVTVLRSEPDRILYSD